MSYGDFCFNTPLSRYLLMLSYGSSSYILCQRQTVQYCFATWVVKPSHLRG